MGMDPSDARVRGPGPGTAHPPPLATPRHTRDITLLLIEAAVASGTAAAVAAGMGVATVDLAFGAVAAATGGAAGAVLSQHGGLIRIAAAAVLAAIALYGIAGILRSRRRSPGP